MARTESFPAPLTIACDDCGQVIRQGEPALLNAAQEIVHPGECPQPRRGDWMQTYTGKRFWPLDPSPEDIDPLDIAHALSLVCRYGGHVRRFYSVAEHCVLMSYAVAPEHALWALLHDAAEAYIGDMVRPLKRFMPEFRDAEDGILLCIALRFGLPWDVKNPHRMPDEVRDADNRIIRTERAAVLNRTDEHWPTDDLEPLPVTIVGWQPAFAEICYYDRLLELLDGRTES